MKKIIEVDEETKKVWVYWLDNERPLVKKGKYFVPDTVEPFVKFYPTKTEIYVVPGNHRELNKHEAKKYL